MTTQTARPTPVRCSDAEREHTSSVVHDAVGEGQLTVAEAEERLAEVYAARYCHELDAVVADLPRQDRAITTGWRAAAAAVWTGVLGLLSWLMATDRRKRAALALGAVAVLGFAVALGFGLALDGPEHGFRHD